MVRYQTAVYDSARWDGFAFRDGDLKTHTPLSMFARWSWMLDDTPVTTDHYTLRFTMHHLSTFWDARESANVVMVHYDDLKADLAAEMRRLAGRLDTTVPESAWPSLVQAATFEDMRQARPPTRPPFSQRLLAGP